MIELDVNKYIDRSKVAMVKLWLPIKSFLSICLGLGCMPFIIILSSSGGLHWSLVVTGSIAFFLIYKGVSWIGNYKAIKNIKGYVRAIMKEPTYAIEKISARLGISQKTFKNNMKFMTRKELIKNIKINYSDNCLVLIGATAPVKNKPIKNVVHQENKTKVTMTREGYSTKSETISGDFESMFSAGNKIMENAMAQMESAMAQMERTMSQKKKEKVTVTCGGCGAKTRTISGESVDCEYCGSPL